MAKKLYTEEDEKKSDVRVSVNVDVPKIVRYLCITGVLIVGIVFGTKTFRKMMDGGFFDVVE